MSPNLEQVVALTTGSLSLLFVASSVCGSLFSLAAAWAAQRFVRQPPPAPLAQWPDVSILKPLCGDEARLVENIETYFHQNYSGQIQIVFGVQTPNDHSLPVIKSLIERYPDLDLQLVVNSAAHGANRKVANLINMVSVARHPVIVMADSDVAVDPNYLRTLAAGLAQPGVGAVTCLYRGLPAAGFWSRLACMAVHDHFLPGTILGLALGLARPCLGATIAVSRETLARIGGLEAVANHLADDYALGDAVRRIGLKVIVPSMLVAHAFEDRSLSDMLGHELRWARTIFTVNPLGYVGSSVTHALPLAVIGAALRVFDAWGLAAVLVALTCRLFLKYRLAREFKLQDPNYGLLLVRDTLSFAVYFGSFLSPRIKWRGQDFMVARDGTLLARAQRSIGSASYGKATR